MDFKSKFSSGSKFQLHHFIGARFLIKVPIRAATKEFLLAE